MRRSRKHWLVIQCRVILKWMEKMTSQNVQEWHKHDLSYKTNSVTPQHSHILGFTVSYNKTQSCPIIFKPPLRFKSLLPGPTLVLGEGTGIVGFCMLWSNPGRPIGSGKLLSASINHSCYPDSATFPRKIFKLLSSSDPLLGCGPQWIQTGPSWYSKWLHFP